MATVNRGYPDAAMADGELSSVGTGLSVGCHSSSVVLQWLMTVTVAGIPKWRLCKGVVAGRGGCLWDVEAQVYIAQACLSVGSASFHSISLPVLS